MYVYKNIKIPSAIVFVLIAIALVTIAATAISIFGANVNNGVPPPSDKGVTPVPTATVKETSTGTPTPTVTATPVATTVTDLQKQLETDKKDPILARRIHDRITPRGEVLIPLNPIPSEFKLYHQELNVYIVGMKMDSKGMLSGTIDNRGDKTVTISDTGFFFVPKDYFPVGTELYRIGDYYVNPETIVIKPGEKKSFSTWYKIDLSGLTEEEYNLRLTSMVSVSPPIVEAQK